MMLLKIYIEAPSPHRTQCIFIGQRFFRFLLSERNISTRLNYVSLRKIETLAAHFETPPLPTLCYACLIRHRLNSVSHSANHSANGSVPQSKDGVGHYYF